VVDAVNARGVTRMQMLPATLEDLADYLEAHRLLGEQAPQLVQLREEFLERMKVLLAEAQAAR